MNVLDYSLDIVLRDVAACTECVCAGVAWWIGIGTLNVGQRPLWRSYWHSHLVYPFLNDEM